MQSSDDYNLENSFKKVSSYFKKAGRSRRELTEQELDFEDHRRIVNSSSNEFSGPTESDAWNQYTHLDDKISDMQFQNENAHIQIRKDFDVKIETAENELRKEISGRLPIKWYGWTVAAIVAIVTLIYVLSYSRVLNKQDDHSKELQELNMEIIEIENSISIIQNDVDLIKESVSNDKSKKTK